MNRRAFLAALVAAPLAKPAIAQPPKKLTVKLKPMRLSKSDTERLIKQALTEWLDKNTEQFGRVVTAKVRDQWDAQQKHD